MTWQPINQPLTIRPASLFSLFLQSTIHYSYYKNRRRHAYSKKNKIMKFVVLKRFNPTGFSQWRKEPTLQLSLPRLANKNWICGELNFVSLNPYRIHYRSRRSTLFRDLNKLKIFCNKHTRHGNPHSSLSSGFRAQTDPIR